MGMFIDVVDGAVGALDNGFLAGNRLYNPNAVSSASVKSMVSNIITRLGNSKIERLRIFGHGRPGAQAVGGGQRPNADQEIASTMFGHVSNKGELARLTSYFFGGDPLVEMHGCSVGRGWKGHLLVKAIANLWHARVRAALGEQFANVADAFEGTHYIQADGTTIHGAKADTYELGTNKRVKCLLPF